MPNKDRDKRLAYARNWAKKQNEKGLCRKCPRPRAVRLDGKILRHCEKHAAENLSERRRKYLSTSYAPPSSLLPLDFFVCVPSDDLAYAAALLEGEGWISPDSRGRSGGRPWAGVKVKMTDPEPVKWMFETFGGRFFSDTPKPPRRKAYYWIVNGRRAGAVIYAVYKFLKSDRKKRTSRVLLKVSSITGWWDKCTYDPRGMKAIENIRNAVLEWKMAGGNLGPR